MPIVKTYEQNAYDDHDDRESSYKNKNFVKALKFYDYRKDGSLIKQFKVDDGVMDAAYRTYDISTLHFGNQVLFYVRYEKWLQLQSYDVVENKYETLREYQIVMPQADDIRYHPIFSKPFGQKPKDLYESTVKTQTRE